MILHRRQLLPWLLLSLLVFSSAPLASDKDFENVHPPLGFVYRTAPERPLRLYVYQPLHDRGEQHAGVVIFHGGGWQRGAPAGFSDFARQLSRRAGVTTITVEYRLKDVDGTTPYEAVDDAKEAVCWVRDNAKSLGVDPQQLVALGASAGGHLALETALSNDDPDGKNCSRTDALILFNPIVDLSGRWEERFAMDLRDISPIHQAGRELPPTLIMQGSADRLAPLDTLKRFIEQHRHHSADHISLSIYPNRGHGFFRKNREGRMDYTATFHEIVVFLARFGWAKAW